MRLPNAVHESRLWRIREIAPDFTLEDVWALPTYGGAGDFPALLEVMTSRDLARQASPLTRVLFGARLLLGRWFGWDDGAERPIKQSGDNLRGARRNTRSTIFTTIRCIFRRWFNESDPYCGNSQTVRVFIWCSARMACR